MLPHLLQNAYLKDNLEIIISDAGSNDNTIEIAQSLDVVTIQSSEKNRAIQMNKGADAAKGDVFYFLHADTFPPVKFDQLIQKSVRNGNSFGCFRLKFDWNHPILKFYQFFTRFNLNICRGGDQSLFVERDLFFLNDGYNEGLILMEDYEIIKRLNKKGKFEILRDAVTSSARKYRRNGVIKLQWHYFIIQVLYRIRISQESLVHYYVRHIK